MGIVGWGERQILYFGAGAPILRNAIEAKISGLVIWWCSLRIEWCKWSLLSHSLYTLFIIGGESETFIKLCVSTTPPFAPANQVCSAVLSHPLLKLDVSSGDVAQICQSQHSNVLPLAILTHFAAKLNTN